MKKSHPQNLESYLHSEHQSLRHLFTKVAELKELNQYIQAVLDPAIAPYCQVANRTGSRIVLLVANGAIATNLRFQLVRLQAKLQQNPKLKWIQQIDYKVSPWHEWQPSASTSTKTKNKMIRPSTATSAILSSMADNLTDPTLKAVMKRIAEQSSSKN